MITTSPLFIALALALLAACGGEGRAPVDSGPADAGASDSALSDSATHDGGPQDAGPPDAGSGCEWMGMHYEVGESFPGDVPCSRCTCTETGVMCRGLSPCDAGP